MRNHGVVACCSGAALAGVCLFAFAWLAPVAQRSAAAQGDAAAGQAVYKKYCVVCHGETGAGDGPATAKMKVKPANLADKAMLSKLTDAQLMTAITDGKKTEGGAMPPFGKKLGEADRKLVIAFLRALAK